MNNPSEYLGRGITATMRRAGEIELSHKSGAYLFLFEEEFQKLVKFHAAGQVEIALRQSLAPAYEAIEQSMKETKI